MKYVIVFLFGALCGGAAVYDRAFTKGVVAASTLEDLE